MDGNSAPKGDFSDPTRGFSRRRALQLGAVGGAALMAPLSLAGPAAAEAGASLDRWMTELPKPRVFNPNARGRYAVGMKQRRHSVHPDVGKVTPVWAYGDRDGYSFPGPTFEVRKGSNVSVRWKNRLSSDIDATHFLEQDDTVWANIHGAKNNRKTVVHVHGAHVASNVDGDPYKTFLPTESRRYNYRIDQEAATLWYHDHSLGNTRLNVTMGLAGFFLVRDSLEDDLIASASIPGPDQEMPLVFMDRRLKESGEFGYDKKFDDMFFGETSLVNGQAWPYMMVEPRKYRFRMLNGANSRTYTVRLPGGLGMTQIGTDGGFLSSPVYLDELTLSPGERADVVIDFGQPGVSVGDDLVMSNTRPSTHDDGDDEYPIREMLQFRVRSGSGDNVVIPPVLNDIVALNRDGATERDFVLEDVYDPGTQESEWLINGKHYDDVTEFVPNGATEVWNWVNKSQHIHPMHIHLVQAQVLSRTRGGANVGVRANEVGWKDTVLVGPHETVTVVAKFDGQRTDVASENYPYHCHVLEHEDHEMMRQFKLIY